jgi:hypothetical protein
MREKTFRRIRDLLPPSSMCKSREGGFLSGDDEGSMRKRDYESPENDTESE